MDTNQKERRDTVLRIADYYNSTDRYIYSERHSNAHQAVFTKEKDRYRWLVLEQKSQDTIEARQTDNSGKITAWDGYILVGNTPKCVRMERLQENLNIHIPFNADEIGFIYWCKEQSKAGMCANLSALLSRTKDSDAIQTVSTTLKKLNVLSDECCVELASAIKRQKTVRNRQSIRERLARAKEEKKGPAVTVPKKDKRHNKGNAGMEL